MASFIKSFNVTAGHEGGYTVDNGGETYKGISRKGWPKWQGWVLIDRYKKANGRIPFKSFIKSDVLDKMVEDFYKKNYWDQILGDYINNQDVANLIYDFYINSASAIIIINRVLNGRPTSNINETTLKIINEKPAFAYETIRQARLDKYLTLAKKPSLAKYKNGWLARLDKFPKTIIAGI